MIDVETNFFNRSRFSLNNSRLINIETRKIRKELFSWLDQHKEDLRRATVSKFIVFGIYGSYATGVASETSDLDSVLFVGQRDETRITYYDDITFKRYHAEYLEPPAVNRLMLGYEWEPHTEDHYQENLRAILGKRVHYNVFYIPFLVRRIRENDLKAWRGHYHALSQLFTPVFWESEPGILRSFQKEIIQTLSAGRSSKIWETIVQPQYNDLFIDYETANSDGKDRHKKVKEALDEIIKGRNAVHSTQFPERSLRMLRKFRNQYRLPNFTKIGEEFIDATTTNPF